MYDRHEVPRLILENLMMRINRIDDKFWYVSITDRHGDVYRARRLSAIHFICRRWPTTEFAHLKFEGYGEKPLRNPRMYD